MKTKRKPRAVQKPKATVRKASVKTKKNTTLIRVEGMHCFWVNNGPVLSDLQELQRALKEGRISEEQWKYHSRKGQNDFANWIEHVFCNGSLAKKVRTAKTRAEVEQILIAALKN